MSKSFAIKKFTPEHIDGIVESLHSSFFTDEVVCNCVSLLSDSPILSQPPESRYVITEGSKELELLTRDMLKDDLSFVAVDESTNEVVGFCVNKKQKKDIPYFDNFKKTMKDKSAIALMDFMIDADNHFDMFSHFGGSCSLELSFLGVSRTARGHRISQRLTEKTIELAKNHPEISFTSALFTSEFSQACGERAGMQPLLKLPYEQFIYKDKRYSDITDQRVVVISGIKC